MFFSLAGVNASALTITTYTDLSDFDAAAGLLTLEDFNDSTLQRFDLGTPYSFNGFTITATNTFTNPVGIGISDTTRSDIDGTPRLVWGENAFGGRRDGPDILFTFDAPIFALAFDWRNTDPTDSYKLVVLGQDFGAGHAEVPWPRPRSLPGSPSQASGFFGLISDTAFTTVTLQHVAKGGVLNDMSMDNVRFSQFDSPAPIPEPGTLALLGIGLAGLVLLRRRFGKA